MSQLAGDSNPNPMHSTQTLLGLVDLHLRGRQKELFECAVHPLGKLPPLLGATPLQRQPRSSPEITGSLAPLALRASASSSDLKLERNSLTRHFPYSATPSRGEIVAEPLIKALVGATGPSGSHSHSQASLRPVAAQRRWGSGYRSAKAQRRGPRMERTLSYAGGLYRIASRGEATTANARGASS